MVRRPGLRAVATTIAAAGVLVGAANLGAYAATGHPLILGRANSAVGTTALRNDGRGPALRLNNVRSAPPLVVNSSKVVKHLNADVVDGKGATDLNGYLQYRVGGEDQVLSNATHFFSVKLPAGDYYWTMTGLWTSATSSDFMECLLVDQRLLSDPSNARYVYADFDKQTGDPDAPFIQQAGFAHFARGQTLVLGCSTTSDTGPVTTVHPVDFTFHPVLLEPRHGTPVTAKEAQAASVIGH